MLVKDGLRTASLLRTNHAHKSTSWLWNSVPNEKRVPCKYLRYLVRLQEENETNNTVGSHALLGRIQSQVAKITPL